MPFAAGLAAHGDRTAIVTADGELSYRDLAVRVAAFGRRLGGERRLVLLVGANTVDAIVAYLAGLATNNPVLLVPGDSAANVESLVAAYDPDVVVRPVAGSWLIDQRRTDSAHELHPDLALLLSTSGSTGSPKLVRLSQENLQANAESIAAYLGIRGSDRAATTLPMHYCYGLSIINSHLLCGAGLILTDLSVADSGFWDLFRRGRGTTFAGVPYTFDLLDRVRFATMRLPHLRYVTQAGGRLAPDRVRQYAELGQRNGWDLFVMYGQTEATARMAYLPPDLAARNPQAIGIPIPGGSFRLEPVPDCADPDTGELVYAGPNVMLGYAETASDLRLGRTVDELHTGDIARRTSDGLYELVGRRSRFVKVFGLRIDLQRIEAMLEGRGLTPCCVADNDELLVAVQGGGDAEQIRRLVARDGGLPVRCVRVRVLAEFPRLATGKLDHRAVWELARACAPATTARACAPATTARACAPATTAGGCAPPPDVAATDLRELYAEILDRSDVTDDSSFVSLGGDSLSYVEMSLRLEQALGHLPADWPTRSIRDLRPTKRRSATVRRTLDTSVALRAIAIVLIVGTHIELFGLAGGAHLLLGIAGFNFARFHLTGAERRERVRRLSASIARIAVASVIWIVLAYLVTDDYRLSNIVLLNTVLGPPVWPEKHFWFIEALVYILVAMAATLTISRVDRLERRFPFGFPMALMTLALVARYDLLVGAAAPLPTPIRAFWLFALGWAAAKATTVRHRLLVTVAVVATVPGFFDDLQREIIVVVGFCLLVWIPSVWSLGPLNRLAGLLAGSSLYIYLTHWQVYPHLKDDSALLAVAASLAFGIVYGMTATYLMGKLSALMGKLSARRLRRPRAGADAAGVTSRA